MIRLPSRLDDETEEYVFERMECGFAVHKAIGPGYGESIYKNAFCVELLARKIPLECEKPFIVKYRDRRHAERGTQENRALTEFIVSSSSS